ncbi:hypothetical protein WJX64_14520 [Leifsonia sp. YIM 134122]|uniref:Uncharacterized protein n=1 Tax=Leifsonia stereocauli TaxID=3134136 RepID=A0ABU9W6Z0_9MICO
MATSPRIVFSTFRSSSDPMLAAWARFRDSVAAAAPDQAIGTGSLRRAPGTWGVWRVLASNNRELARSAMAYSSFESARAHAISIRERVNELDIVLVTGARAGNHGWYFALDGTAVLTCGRWYGGSAVGLEAALATLDAMRSGMVGDSPHELSASRRTLRVPLRSESSP